MCVGSDTNTVDVGNVRPSGRRCASVRRTGCFDNGRRRVRQSRATLASEGLGISTVRIVVQTPRFRLPGLCGHCIVLESISHPTPSTSQRSRRPVPRGIQQRSSRRRPERRIGCPVSQRLRIGRRRLSRHLAGQTLVECVSETRRTKHGWNFIATARYIGITRARSDLHVATRSNRSSTTSNGVKHAWRTDDTVFATLLPCFHVRHCPQTWHGFGWETIWTMVLCAVPDFHCNTNVFCVFGWTVQTQSSQGWTTWWFGSGKMQILTGALTKNNNNNSKECTTTTVSFRFLPCARWFVCRFSGHHTTHSHSTSSPLSLLLVCDGQESGCKGLCLHQCKLPAQQFFQDTLGLPLTVSPNFVTQECQWSFGETPLPPDQDPSFPRGCLAGCESRKAVAALGIKADLCSV